MRQFNITYKQPFRGKGVAYLHDAALILVGALPKFPAVRMITSSRVFTIKTSLTIPYNTIVKCDKGCIVYRLPNGKQTKIAFKNAKVFAAELAAYKVAAERLHQCSTTV